MGERMSDGGVRRMLRIGKDFEKSPEGSLGGISGLR